ncbi:aldehyde dehydrogenase family protein [Streptomyces hoynatensis]|uniref:Aldehyde dehydrogenase family protein n=1 Tax=Streptomyces hoynatensis TaxID=1141874 RepID=A0A3A9Z9M0_9ACTN|nr:aldehyde dehydrogenase family protein [Streptomyces hoynatensis]RKN43997.1 aldehyde dehydrogenase family protein [Streptomyces hoynatensis]
MAAAERPSGLYLDGAWRSGNRRLAVLDKYSLEPVAEVAEATPADVLAAVDGACRAAAEPPPPGERARVLRAVADALEAEGERVVADYVAETGFTLADARGELARAARIYRLSAEEAVRIAGEQVPISAPGGERRLAFTFRVPVGVVVAITPFNAPLSTVAHKIGPALAAGNAVVLKPAEKTPLSAVHAVRAFHEAGLPAGLLQLVCGTGEDLGEALVGDPRVRFYTFTGSTAVGRRISARAGLARTQLELGSNSASIVAADADVERVAALVARAGYRKAGQVCTSVQRLLVDRSRLGDLAEATRERVQTLVAGDPRDPASSLGPLIDPAEAERAAAWVAQARPSARLALGGERDKALLTPALLVDPDPGSRVLDEEIFAPVVSLVPVDDVDHAIRLVNEGPYGLQAGIFTHDLDLAFRAARRLRVGGVMINDTSSYHADEMPYGGVKESGHGQEGPKYAVHDMTDPRLVVLNL